MLFNIYMEGVEYIMHLYMHIYRYTYSNSPFSLVTATTKRGPNKWEIKMKGLWRWRSPVGQKKHSTISWRETTKSKYPLMVRDY